MPGITRNVLPKEDKELVKFFLQQSKHICMKKPVVVNHLKKSCIRLKLTKGSNKEFELKMITQYINQLKNEVSYDTLFETPFLRISK